MADETVKINTPGPQLDEVAAITKDFDIYWGWIKRLENPDPVLRTEGQGKGLKLYDEVSRDAHAGAVLQSRYLAVVGKEWEIIAADSGKKVGRTPTITKEQKIADFVQTILLACNFDQFRQELLESILYGYYVGEVIWRVENNQVTIEKLRAKHPRRFIFTPERELRLLTLYDMVQGEAVPDHKFIIMTYGSSDIPYGDGIGKSIWWPVWFKKNAIKFWMIYSEKFGSPTPVGKYPAGSTESQKKTLLSALEAIQQETGITIPDGMTIEFLEAQRAGTINTYESLCKFMDKQISKRVLGQTATTEGTPGRLGNEKAQQEVRDDIIKADADVLCECLNESLIKWLVDFNFGPQAAYPKLWIRTNAELDLKPLADRDKLLSVDIGVPITKKYFYDTYAIPEPLEGEDLVKPTPPVSNPFGQQPQNQPLADPTKFSRHSRGIIQFDEMDDWIAHYMDRLKPSLQNARINAQDDVETWLRSLHLPPSEAELQAKVSDILGSSYSSLNRKAIADTITEIYKTYREASTVTIGFGAADIRSVNFLSKLDNFYFSKWVDNPDAQKALHGFISDQYLENGAGLFGRGSAEDIQSFRDLLGQKVADLEDWQIRRITDTSVARVRNWGSVAQMRSGGIASLQIYEPTQECDFCKAMNGRVISAATAYSTMMDQATMSPEEYTADLKANVPTVDNIDAFVGQGLLPPYHPHCRGIVIKKMG